MKSAPSKDQYEKLHVLMDVVDTARHEKMEAERMVGQAMDDEALISQVLRVYRSQGMPVDEATVREGLALMKSRRFEFNAPRPSLATRLAGIYISRDRWGQKARAIAGAMAIIIGATFLAVALSQAAQERSWMRGASASVQTQAQIEARAQDLGSQAEQISGEHKALADIASQAREQLGQARQTLTGMPQLPESKKERGRFYEQDKPAAKASLAQRRKALESASQGVGAAQNSLHEARGIQQALQGSGVLDEPAPQHLQHLQGIQRLEFERSLAEGDAQGMHAAINTFTQAVALDGRRTGMLGQITSLGEIESSEVLGQAMDEARAALMVGNVSAARALMDDVSEKLEILPLSYTLRIANDPGQMTVVWRYYDGNRGKRSHYVVVDALDSSGTPVALPIQSAEDNGVSRVSRFAIRVPEKVYDAVAKDKTDDGIIDNPIFGYKRAGQLSPTYEFETLGGMITDW